MITFQNDLYKPDWLVMCTKDESFSISRLEPDFEKKFWQSISIGICKQFSGKVTQILRFELLKNKIKISSIILFFKDAKTMNAFLRHANQLIAAALELEQAENESGKYHTLVKERSQLQAFISDRNMAFLCSVRDGKTGQNLF